MSKISTYEVAPVPKLADKLIGTSVGGEIEDVTYNFTLQELLDVFLPVIPANNLQGVLDYGNTATQDINLFGTITTTNLEVTDTANFLDSYFVGETHIEGGLFDSTGSIGLAGQVLASTGTTVDWITLPPIFTPNLQQVLTEGNTSTIGIILDAGLEALDVDTDTATINTNITIDGTLTDGDGGVGVAGNVLSSTLTGVKWVALPVYSATSPLLFNSATGVFSIQQATNAQNGYLSSTDWITFNGKQNAGNYITALTGEVTASGPGSVAATVSNAAVIGKVLTGFNPIAGTINASDSILTAFGKTQSQINALVGGVQYQGVWNANTNNPTLISSVGVQGHYYVVNVAGNTNLNGITDWQIGDWAIFSESTWQKVDNTESVSSVNGFTGAVSLTTDNIPEGTTNLYFLNSRARLALSATSPLGYDNSTGVFSIQQASGSQAGFLSSTDWTTFNGKQNYLGGTGLVKSTAGTISYITDNSTNWDTAYDNMIISAAVTGTTNKTLTLTQQDAGTITASWTDLGLTSVGLSMPLAFNVANSPLTANGTIAVTAAGVASQYIRGDGTLANFPTNGGGGSSVSYYLNGSVNQGTFGGNTYYEMSKTPIIGAGTDFSISANGYIAQFITDAGDPALLNIPAGNWNFETYFSASSGGGTPSFYIELYKYDGVVFTLIASNSGSPKVINDATSIEAYFSALAVPQTSLTLTDRLAIRIYVNHSGRTITLHTENSHLCQVITTFSTGLTALNGLTAQVQYFQTGTSGTDFNIVSSNDTHTFNIPNASATARGLISTGTQTIEGIKTFNLSTKNETGIQLKNDIGIVPLVSGYTNLNGLTNGLAITNSSAISNNLLVPATIGYSYTFPALSGTIALISNLSGYVPYTGATANVNLGTYTLQGSALFATNSVGTSGGLISLSIGSTFSSYVGHNTIAAAANGVFVFLSDISSGAALKEARFNFGSLTNNTTRTFTFPDASGTIALTSSIPSNIITGTGTNNYISKFTSTGSTLGNSGIFDNGTNVIFGGTSNTSANPTVVMQNRLGTVLSVAGFNWAGTTTDNNSVNSLMIIGGYLNTSAQTVATAANASGMQFFNGGFYWYGNSGLTPGSVYTNTQRMFLTVGGNLIIGSGGDGGFRLDVSGTARLTGALTATSATFSSAVVFNSTTTHSGVASFGVGSPTAFATDGTLIIPKIRLYNGTPASIYSDFVSAATTNRSIVVPDASGTLALTSDLSNYLPLSGGVMTGQIVLKESSSSTDFTKGLRFPNDPFGGNNDIAGLRLYSTLGENMVLELYTGNDGALDVINFATGIGGTPNNNTVTINGNRIWNAGNLSSPISGTGTAGTIPVFTDTGVIGNSTITEAEGSVYVNNYLIANAAEFQGNSSFRTTGNSIGNSIQISLGTTVGSTMYANIISTIVDNVASQFKGRLDFQVRSGNNSFVTPLSLLHTGVTRFNLQATYASLTYEQTIQYATSPAGIWFGNSFNSNNNVALQLRTSNDGTSVQALTITPIGNVGIGTSSPGNFSGVGFTGPFLDVAGVLQVKGTSANGVAIIQLGGDTYRKATIETSIGTQDPFLAFGTASSGSSSSNTERMRITSGGNVIIQRPSSGATLLYLSGSSAYGDTSTLALCDNRSYIRATIIAGTPNGDTDITFGTQSSGVVAERVRINTDGQTRFQNSIILTNGQMNSLTTGGGGQSMYLNFIGNGAIYAGSSYAILYAGSDRRIKSDIEYVQSTLDKVLSLTPKTFKYKERPEFTNYGFIAQEVEEVMPELVRTSEGITICNGEEIVNQKSIESYGLAWASILVKAIQEQQAQIKELKALINK